LVWAIALLFAVALLIWVEMVNIFGQNLSKVRLTCQFIMFEKLTDCGQTDGQQWQRHRKVTAICFNEQNNELVWSESLIQAQVMLRVLAW